MGVPCAGQPPSSQHPFGSPLLGVFRLLLAVLPVRGVRCQSCGLPQFPVTCVHQSRVLSFSLSQQVAPLGILVQDTRATKSPEGAQGTVVIAWDFGEGWAAQSCPQDWEGEAVSAVPSQDKPRGSTGCLLGRDQLPPQHCGHTLPRAGVRCRLCRGGCRAAPCPRHNAAPHPALLGSGVAGLCERAAPAPSLSHPHPQLRPHPYTPFSSQSPSSQVPGAAAPAWELFPKRVCMFFKANTLWLSQHHPT